MGFGEGMALLSQRGGGKRASRTGVRTRFNKTESDAKGSHASGPRMQRRGVEVSCQERDERQVGPCRDVL